MNFENRQNNSHIVFVMFTRVALRITSLTGQHTFLKIEHLCLHVYVVQVYIFVLNILYSYEKRKQNRYRHLHI